MLQVIRNAVTIMLFFRMIWIPVAAVSFLIGMFLLQCGPSERHRTEKRIIDQYPRQMQQLRDWRLK